MKVKIKKFYLLIGFCAFLFSACQSVKGYQKGYLNDEDMKLSLRKSATYEINAESYREGASGGNTGKSGGGCGCN